MRRLSLLAAAATVLVFVVGKCAIYDSTLLTPAEGGDAGDASVASDVVSDAGSTMDVDLCPHARPPAKPSADDPSDGGDIELVAAVQALDLGVPNDAGVASVLGYDLDGLCTCPGPEACTATSSTAPPHCDDSAGRDNSGGALLRQFSDLSGGLFTQASINQQLVAGQYGLLLRVRHYNGQPNDNEVELSIYVSDGTPRIVDDAGTSSPTPPKWDGSDTWTVDSKSAFGGSGPPFTPLAFDSKAYVSGGVLVGALDYDVAFGFNQEDVLRVNLTSGTVSAKLVQAAEGVRMTEGQLTGRWSISSLLTQLRFVHDPASTAYLCPSTQTYADLKLLACPAADVPTDPKAGLTATCDAMSMALGFKAEPAFFGAVQTIVIPTTCADGGVDTCK